jgi:cyclase
VEEIAPGVWTVDHRVAEGKNGVIVGERGALAIDTGTDEAEGEAVVAAVRAAGFEPNRLLLTHGHNDHVLGSAVFRGAEVFAHSLCPEVIRRHMPAMRERHGDRVDGITWPTVTFSGELTIDLGGKSVRIFPTPGHSADGVAAYVVEDRVLFASDAAVTAIPPAVGDGDSATLVATLRGLRELGAEVLVPGHGQVVRGAGAVRAALTWNADYLEALRAFAGEELARGTAPESIPERADYDRFVGGHLLPERHGMLKRHRDIVAKIVQETR